MIAGEIPFFSGPDISRLLKPSDAAAAISSALREDLDPARDIPRRSVPVRNGEFLLMPSQSPGAAGIKVLTVAPGNPRRGLARIQGLYLLFDAVSLSPTAILDGAALTALRTPAVSAALLAATADRFAAPVRLVVFGGGPQGVAHISALAAVEELCLARVTVIVPDPAPVRLPDGLAPVPIHLLASDDPSTHEAVATADIVVCATTSRTPVFDSSALRPGAVVIAIGSHEPDARELDGALMGEAVVVVEDVATALREAGDVVMAIQEGRLTAGRLATLRDVVRGAHHIDPRQSLVLKTTGMAWEDIVIAQAVVERSSALRAAGSPEPAQPNQPTSPPGSAMSTPPYSPFRRAGGLVTFSGLLGRVNEVPVDGLEAQLRLIFEQLDERLSEAGLERRHVIKTTVWLSDMNDWAAMTALYLEYFAGMELPTRSAVGAQLRPGCVVELEAWAHEAV